MCRRGLLMAVSLLALAGNAMAGPPGEFSLFAGYWTGDYGTGVESSTQALTFRYVYGNRWRLRAELPLMRLQPSETAIDGAPVPSRIAGHGLGSSGNQGGNGTGPGSGGPYSLEDPSGFGDLRVAGTYSVIGGGAKLFRMEAGVELKAPTADEDRGLGTGEWDLRAGLSGEYRFWPVTAFGGLGWNRFGDPAWVELNDVADMYAGLEGDTFGGRLSISGWIEACPEVVDGVGHEIVAGLEFRSLRRYRWRAGFTAGLGDFQEYGVVLGYSFQSGGASRGHRGMYR